MTFKIGDMVILGELSNKNYQWEDYTTVHKVVAFSKKEGLILEGFPNSPVSKERYRLASHGEILGFGNLCPSELGNKFDEKPTYSVQQVLQATEELFDTGMLIHTQEIEKYLVKQQDPEWKEYQRLKEKFEG